MNIIAQILGFFALIFSVMSYQKTNKKGFLIVQVIANLFYISQYACLNAYSALIVVIISTIRALIFFMYEKKNKKIPLALLIIFIIITIIAGVFTYETYWSILPIIIVCLFAYGTWQKNLKVTYTIGIMISILWIIYNSVVGAYVSAISAIFEGISSTIGLIRLIKKSKKKIK